MCCGVLEIFWACSWNVLGELCCGGFCLPKMSRPPAQFYPAREGDEVGGIEARVNSGSTCLTKFLVECVFISGWFKKQRCPFFSQKVDVFLSCCDCRCCAPPLSPFSKPKRLRERRGRFGVYVPSCSRRVKGSMPFHLVVST